MAKTTVLWIVRRSLFARKAFVVLVQGALVVLSAYLAFLIRFEGEIPGPQMARFWSAVPILLGLRMAAFCPFSLFQGLWRYASLADLRNIGGAVGVSSLAFLVLERRLGALEGYSRSVLVIDSLLLCFLLGCVRLPRRLLRGAGTPPARQCRLIIVGAGDAGETILREIELHPEYGYLPVGFVDDDRTKLGARIRGVKVLGTRRNLKKIVDRTRAEGILIAIPSASPEQLREIAADCRRTGLPVKILPSIGELLVGGKLLDAAVDVQPEELLCRPAHAVPSEELEAFYRGKTVLVTGAGGSIGSELVRQLAQFGVARLVLFERHEFSLYEIDRKLRERGGASPHVPIVGDVCDRRRVRSVLEEYEPSIVFHAAAYKHVPLMESNPGEAVKVNVAGTKNVLDLAVELGVQHFVFISSDKAVNPVSVMGATKRLGELLVREYSEICSAGGSRVSAAVGGSAPLPFDGRRFALAPGAWGGAGFRGGNGASRTRCVAVRFGNVLESSGSVVPLFKEQILRGGPVTVTHPEVERYFMTTREAVHLVLWATVLGEGGEVFVLDMGGPVRLLEMARHLISLYGYEPEKDIPIVFTGLRPGERLKESLFYPDEEVRPTGHPKLRVAVPKGPVSADWRELWPILAPYWNEAFGSEPPERWPDRALPRQPVDPVSRVDEDGVRKN